MSRVPISLVTFPGVAGTIFEIFRPDMLVGVECSGEFLVKARAVMASAGASPGMKDLNRLCSVRGASSINEPRHSRDPAC